MISELHSIANLNYEANYVNCFTYEYNGAMCSKIYSLLKSTRQCCIYHMDYLNIEYFAHVGAYTKNSQRGECRKCHQLQTMSSTVVGEVESLVAALHSSLLTTDRELQELGAEEEVLEAWHKTQQGQSCLVSDTCDHGCMLGCPKKNFFGISFPRLNHWCGLVPRAPEKKFSVIDP